MKKEKCTKILYSEAVKNWRQNFNTQNGAQKLSAQNSRQNGAQKCSVQNIATNTKHKRNPREIYNKNDPTPENISLIKKRLQKAK
jgi:hypothetical protein